MRECLRMCVCVCVFFFITLALGIDNAVFGGWMLKIILKKSAKYFQQQQCRISKTKTRQMNRKQTKIKLQQHHKQCPQFIFQIQMKISKRNYKKR